jgi:hypothetical protein
MAELKPCPIDYTYEPPITPEQKRFKAEIIKAGRETAEKVNQYYNEFLATMIKMFCEKNKCDVLDIAIYQGIDGMNWKIWVDFKDKQQAISAWNKRS